MATNKSGIFTLGDVGDRQSTQSWTTASDVWLVNKPVAVAESPFGYFAGGRGGGQPGPRSDVDRVDYSNDTSIASVRGPLDRHRFYTGAIGSLSYAYVVAGNTGGGDADAETTVSRIDYSNDTNIAAPKGPLTRKSGDQEQLVILIMGILLVVVRILVALHQKQIELIILMMV